MHQNNFNVLRLLLAVLVLLSHSPELIDGNRDRETFTQIFHTISAGELAVNTFFLISGYLIVQSWQHQPQFVVFLRKRILRIYPGFIAAALLCAFLVGPLAAHAREYVAQFDSVGFLRSMILLQPPQIPPVFAGTPYPFVNNSMWTIAYEFRCYCLVAFLGMGGGLRKEMWLAFSTCVLVLSLAPDSLGSVSFKGSSVLLGDPAVAIRFLTFFAAGGCFYLFRERIRYRSRWVLFALPIVLLSLFHLSALQIILPTLGAYVLFGFVFAPIPMLDRFRNTPDVSYGIYLYGWPIQKLLTWYFPWISIGWLFVLSSALSFMGGWFSWRLVERPFMKLKLGNHGSDRPTQQAALPKRSLLVKR